MSASSPTLGAVVVAARGGAHLERALEAVGWADARAVVELDDRNPSTLPPGVVRLTDAASPAAIGTDWVLLLFEEERLRDDGERALRAAVAAAGSGDVLGLRCVLAVLDLRVRLGQRVVRLAPRRTPLVVRAGLEIEFVRAGRNLRLLDVEVTRSRGATLNETVEIASAEATTLAPLIDARVGKGQGIMWQSLVAGVRALSARAIDAPLGLGRWVIAVLEAYRVVIVYAKLWERRRDRVTMVTG
jgi:hypothetical protein